MKLFDVVLELRRARTGADVAQAVDEHEHRVPGNEVRRRGYGSAGDKQHQPFFGITIASCERGAMRQSADGLIVYADDAVRYHDGAWGRATLEVCLGVIESARTRREVAMRFQVPIG